MQIYTCLDAISRVEWSPDSQMLLAAQYKRALVQVFSLERPTWVCRIDEGPVGLSFARWAPDSRHLLTSSDYSLRLTIWSLVDRSSAFIRCPKFPAKACEFSHDGRFLAVVERREFKDIIGVYAVDTWELVKHFQVDTVDLEDLAWSPDDRHLCVWDSPLEYKFMIYSPLGRKYAEHRAYENALGIKGVAWSPTAQFLAVGSYDEVCRVFTNLTWRTIAEYSHLPLLTTPSLVVYQEAPDDSDATAANAAASVHASSASLRYRSRRLIGAGAALNASAFAASYPAAAASTPAAASLLSTRYVIVDPPVAPVQVKPEADKPNPRLGVGLVAWSHDSRYLVTRNDNMPNSIWIWETGRLSLASTMLQLEAVRAFQWHPSAARLAICTGNSKLYLWSEEGCSIVAVPIPGMSVQNIKWSASGHALLLIDREQCCLCYFDNDELVVSEDSSVADRCDADSASQTSFSVNLSEMHDPRRVRSEFDAEQAIGGGDSEDYEFDPRAAVSDAAVPAADTASSVSMARARAAPLGKSSARSALSSSSSSSSASSTGSLSATSSRSGSSTRAHPASAARGATSLSAPRF